MSDGDEEIRECPNCGEEIPDCFKCCSDCGAYIPNAVIQPKEYLRHNGIMCDDNLWKEPTP